MAKELFYCFTPVSQFPSTCYTKRNISSNFVWFIHSFSAQRLKFMIILFFESRLKFTKYFHSQNIHENSH